MYKIFAKLLEEKGLKTSTVASATGISNMTFSDWKKGKSTPKLDKLQKIADYFGVTVDYLMCGEETTTKYYLNDEAEEMARFMFENPDYKVLFDASRKLKKEDIAFVKSFIDRMTAYNDAFNNLKK